MKKKIFAIASAFLCFTTMFGVGCGGNSSTRTYDTESDRFRLAIGALEGNYNPFFYTAANDGDIAAMTQLPLMTIDENGELVVGEDEACVALAYNVTTYDSPSGGSPTVTGTMKGRTEYEIIIKNGIKFSDGVDLTIKDVLFNFYVYLDPAYTGSSTIYSTNIQGLNRYRTQNPSAVDGATTDLDSQFRPEAQAKIDALIQWSSNLDIDSCNTDDLATVTRLFREEATSDWATYETGWEDTYGAESKYSFTEAWQAYLFAEGLIEVQTRTGGNGAAVQVEEDGKYLTTLDQNAEGVSPVGEIQAQEIINQINAAASEANVAQYVFEHQDLSDDPEEAERLAKLQLQKEYCIDLVVTTYTNRTKIADVLQYWATGSNALSEFIAQLRTAHYATLAGAVDSITGITTSKTTQDFNGNELGEEHDVLKIVINGVDPKAIWNFCFSIAPLHYYSGTYNGTNYVDGFDGTKNFGVKVGDAAFYTEVLKDPAKNGLPVGAGSYMASTQSGTATRDASQFSKNNVVYFMRNEYFTTVGEGIENAKIKYVSYQVMSDSVLVSALERGQIDYAEPNATTSNQNSIYRLRSSLAYETYRTGGYGYVGINPKYVPDVKIRRAIMKALDASLTVEYYGESLADRIYRPMSRTSWVYDYERTNSSLLTEHANVSYDATPTNSEITGLVADAGYTRAGGTGVYTHQTTRQTLKFTFTIAGESSDHPAYQMFTTAQARLNALGFDITVQTDISALAKLNSGTLAVWAAAWSSSIDPDMYQVYHKDSTATSVNNWNYPAIKAESSSWSYERRIINRLSTRIVEARQTLDRQLRSQTYVNCLNDIMELAVEFPTYQRSTLAVYNRNKLNRASMTQSPSHNLGLIGKIWEVDYIK